MISIKIMLLLFLEIYWPEPFEMLLKLEFKLKKNKFRPNLIL